VNQDSLTTRGRSPTSRGCPNPNRLHAQHQRALRRVQVKTHHVDRLLHELRIVGELKRATWCGLSCSRQIRCTVVGEIQVACASRRTLQCVVASGGCSRRLGPHALHVIVVDLPRPARPRRIPNPLQPALAEVPTPLPKRRQRHPQLRRDLRVAGTLSRRQHNSGQQRLHRSVRAGRYPDAGATHPSG
jgi:hypothetical protein